MTMSKKENKKTTNTTKKQNGSKNNKNITKTAKKAKKANESKTLENKSVVTAKENINKKNNTNKMLENNTEKYSSKFGSTKPVKNVEKHTGTDLNEDNELIKLVKLILVVCVVIAIFYVITYFIKDNKSSITTNNSDEYTEIQYDEIILGELLNRKEETYYVLAYSSDSKYADLYNMYLSYYELEDNALKVYTTDLDSVFNKKYISTESNLNVTNVSDLKIKDVTLFKINNKQIESYYEGKDAVIEYLKSL